MFAVMLANVTTTAVVTANQPAGLAGSVDGPEKEPEPARHFCEELLTLLAPPSFVNPDVSLLSDNVGVPQEPGSQAIQKTGYDVGSTCRRPGNVVASGLSATVRNAGTQDILSGNDKMTRGRDSIGDSQESDQEATRLLHPAVAAIQKFGCADPLVAAIMDDVSFKAPSVVDASTNHNISGDSSGATAAFAGLSMTAAPEKSATRVEPSAQELPGATASDDLAASDLEVSLAGVGLEVASLEETSVAESNDSRNLDQLSGETASETGHRQTESTTLPNVLPRTISEIQEPHQPSSFSSRATASSPRIADQIATETLRQASLHFDHQSQVFTMRLDPPDLGRLTIQMERTPDALKLVVHVEDVGTLDLVRDSISDLQTSIELKGTALKGLDVSVFPDSNGRSRQEHHSEQMESRRSRGKPSQRTSGAVSQRINFVA